MSRSEAARKSGLTEMTIARLEKGGNPTLDTLERLAEAYGMPPGQIVDVLVEKDHARRGRIVEIVEGLRKLDDAAVGRVLERVQTLLELHSDDT